MAPPAKRRRRNKRDDSADDHDQDGDYQDGSGPPTTKTSNTLTNFLLSSSPGSPANTRSLNASSSTSPASKGRATRSSNSRASPRKTRGVQAGAVPKNSDDKAKGGGSGGGGLRALFSRQAQQRSTSGKRPAAAAADVISSDPISEDDEISEVKASSSSIVGQRLRKRQRGGLSAPTPTPRLDNKNSNSSNNQHITPAPSQRFLKPSRITPTVVPYTVTTTQNDEDARPWSERFGPQNLDELAVHKKKVADVRRWLDEVMSGRMRRQRLLVLKGAAGTGKTTTVRLLARELGCELLEWRNPAGGSIGTGFVSYSAQFNDFLGRGGKFGALDLDVDSSAPTPTPTPTPTQSSGAAHPDRDRRIMLIEEFPNTFFRSSPALASFRSALLQFLSLRETPPPLSAAALSRQQQQRGQQQETPAVVVLVISETLLATTSASADSLTAHRLLGPEILSHPGVGVIEFNAVAPSLLARALDLVVRKEARRSGRRRTPGPPVLKRLCEAGDVRSAVSSLEFLCLKGDEDADWSAKVAFTKPKRGTAATANNKNNDAMTRSERDSLELVSRREASLGIFHAVGRVVYNKRQEPSAASAADVDVEAAMPRHLSQHARPHRSHVAVDALMGETGTDPHTFVAALHENYLPSCDGTGPMDLSTPTDYVNECIEHLSLADLMGPSHDIFFGGSSSSFRGGGGADSASHVLRRDEMMFEVAVRGLLFSLPYPVTRRASAGDAFKMFYPASLKLWRAREEISDLADLWASRLLRDDLVQKDQHRNPPPSATATITSTSHRHRHTPSSHPIHKQPPPFVSLGSVARRELLLERLPYMKLIARASSSRKHCQQALHLSSSRLRDLDKIVSFHPASAAAVVSSRNDEEDVDEEREDAAIAANDDWATDRLSDETSPRRKRAGIKPGAVTNMLAQKLVLSDDDIED